MVPNFNVLQRQFLCCYPINLINWQKILKDLSWDEQKMLLDYTVLNDINNNYPVKQTYQLNFMKSIIQTLEENCSEIHDLIYETFCTLQTTSNSNIEKFYYKHYIIPESKILVTLKESVNFVTDGTTGLCSWQASIALADFLLNNSEIIKNKLILELGSGTGLCSFLLAKCFKLSKIILSDGSLKVIDLLYENLKRNFKNSEIIQEVKNYKLFNSEVNEIGIWHLPWEEIKEYQLEEFILPEIILGSDIIYDEDILPVLSRTIDYLFLEVRNNCVMYLAATVRNEATFKKFLQLLDGLRFTYKRKLCKNDETKLFWDNRTPIEILCIKRKS